MKHLKRFTALLLTFVIALGIPISANAIQDWYGVSAVSYTHLDVYKRQSGTSSALYTFS